MGHGLCRAAPIFACALEVVKPEGPIEEPGLALAGGASENGIGVMMN